MAAIKTRLHIEWHDPAAIQREKQAGRNIDGEIERERDATLSRLILKFCTQESAVNHSKTHRGKKPSSVLFTTGGTIWMHYVSYRWPAGVWGRKRTRTEKGVYI